MLEVLNKMLSSLALGILIALTACSPVEVPQIMTVAGPIPSSDMGITLPHEHILVDFIGADSTGYHRWDRQQVMDKALPYLVEARSLGLSTFIDATPAWLGRDPELLRMVSSATGLNLLTNTGLYGAYDGKYVPRQAFEMTAEELAGEWIAEYRDGIEGTGVRPGFIKIAVDRRDSLSALQEKIVRAAAITHLQTGLVIMSHTGTDGPAFRQLALLEEMGVSPDAFIWTHSQGGTSEGRIRAAGMGAWISLDKVTSDQLERYAGFLQELKSAGHLDRALISHDSGWYRVGEKDGGSFKGYAVIFREFIPYLKQKDFTDAEINQLIVENPARAFAVRNIH